jgi:hypothetical protein
MDESASICPCTPDSLTKYFYLGVYGLGITCLSTCAALRISGIAQEHNHPDPVSEGCAAFVLTESVGCFVGGLGYNYCFRDTPAIPVLEMNRGPSNTFLKKQSRTQNGKIWHGAVKVANRKRDNAQKRHNKIKHH